MGSSPEVHATDKDAARKAFTEGSHFYDVADFGHALEAFKRAYFAWDDPNILYNIAQCQRALGDRALAVDAYRSYLRKSPRATNRADVEHRIAELSTPTDVPTVAEGATLEPTPADATVLVAHPVQDKPAHHRRAWVWGVVGGGIALGLGLGIGLGVGLTRSHAPHADSTVTF
ncbi:MAG: tetratricopeptide repeat protein [Polyangia bacterium]